MKNKFLSGFTLVELMITVAIIAIIAAIAYPSYQEQVRETRRANAQADLLELSSYMERYYTERFTYTGAVLPFITSPKQGGTAFYNLSFQGNPDANSYTIQAVPTGADRCGTMTINEVGQRNAGGANCW
ncbi:type IV pilin protein [Methylophaga nitratireducenticrescens]|uniref:type IV pilin protein n=1 Tax=Methylophaga nitratireducenticrescens TaxID=754476 RepID=UPI000CDBB71C|nr:type IV pilin protein [Methylophaga nitratireducenticrescens]AUZ85697.1 pilus assembly protein PilE [Methylophaga nitratireducenticrescens]